MKAKKSHICQHLFIYLFIYSFFNVDNYRTNTVYNEKNSNKILIDVNTLVKKPIEHNTFYKKNKTKQSYKNYHI